MRPRPDPLDDTPDRQAETGQAADQAERNDAEQWARRALGPDHGPGRDDRPNHRHQAGPGFHNDGRPAPMRRRFARDGDVTVVLAQPGTGVGLGSAQRLAASATPPVNRLANAEAALAAEQAARQQAERALAEAQASVKRLQTQLAHVEMTMREALETAQRAEIDRAAMAAALDAERAAHPPARPDGEDGHARLSPAAGALPKAARAPSGGVQPIDPLTGKRKRGRPRRTDGTITPKRASPKPVKWW